MTTFEGTYQRLRHAGISHEDAQKEAQIQTNYERGLAAQAEAQQRATANPTPAHTWDRYDDMERRTTAQWAAINDPQRNAIKAANRARIQAQMRPLVEQRDALNRQIAAIEEQYRHNL